MTKNWTKYTMMPQNAMVKHPFVEQRLLDLAEYAETSPLNRMEMGDPRVGILTSGAAYSYAREAFPEASFLKLGMTYPVPERMIADFRAKVEKLYVVEELDPFLEEILRLKGIKIDGGKDLIPICGELDPGLVARALTAAGVPGANPDLFAQPTPGGRRPARPPAHILPGLLATVPSSPCSRSCVCS